MTSSAAVNRFSFSRSRYPDCLEKTKGQVSQTPSPYHVLISIKAAALNPVDIQLMNEPKPDDQIKVPGCDFAGVITAASPESGYDVGDEVMGISLSGGMLQETVHCDVRQVCMIQKPSHLDWIKAASLPLVWLTARTTIDHVSSDLKTQPQKLVILGGSSSTGIYNVIQAKKRGLHVLSSCSSRNVDFVKSLGAENVVDYTVSDHAVVDAVKSYQPQAIIDNVGGTECIGLANRYVTIVGDKTSRSAMGGPILYGRIRAMWWRWLFGYVGLGKAYDCVILKQNKDWLEEVKDLKPEEVVVDSVFKFDDTKKAYERLNTGRARGKVVVDFE